LWFWCGVIFLVFVAACNSSDVSTSRPRVLTIGFAEGTANRAGLGAGSLIISATLEGLTQVNTSVDGRVLPRLAERWTWENGGRALRLSLRKGVIFHDSTPLTAEIAVGALRRAIDQPGYRALYPSLGDIAAVRADGDLELVVELSRPSAFLPDDLEVPLAVGTNNVGTGPFRLVKRDSFGAQLERFDRYYLGAPQIEQIVIRPFDTLRTAWANLLRDEVDMVTDVPPESVDFIRNDEIQLTLYARWYQFLIVFNPRRAPFTSPAVRRALNVAVDREALIANVLQGQGQPSTGPFAPRHWAYDSSVLPYPFDPEFATTLLDNVGFVPGAEPGSPRYAPARLRFTCLLPEGFSLLERLGLEVQKHLYDIGVDMQFEVVSFADYDARIREGRFEAVLVDMISGPTLARQHVFWGAPRREGLHALGYQNAEAARLFELLRTSTNEAAIRSTVSRLQRVMLEDPPALFLAWNQRARAVSTRFRVAGEPGRDPLLTIWQWTENSDRPRVSTQ
jgi:peptide/nickel transport system substrate-binding protein